MPTTPNDKAPWTPRADLVVQIASPEVAAEKLGRTIEEVMTRRQELGVPEPPRKFRSSGEERTKKP